MARILVIDDDASLLQMMSIMLKRAGHEPILANNGNEGIAAAKREVPDVAIVDVMMPDVSGYEVCRALRADQSTMNIPLLILTALSQPEQRDQAEDAGADDFVTKPVTRDDLVNSVEYLLEHGAQNMPAPPTPAEPELAPPQPVQSTPVSPSADLDRPAPPPPGFEPASAQPPVAVPVTSLPVIAVMGLGRSVGATTIAVNLGLGMMQFGRSCVVDLHDQDGQVASHLKMMPPRSTWADLIGLTPNVDKRLIGGALLLGHPSGVALLASPPSPPAGFLTGGTLQYIFSVLSEGFRKIVVDLPMTLSANSLATLRRAQHIILVVGDDPAALYDVPSTLATLQELGLQNPIHIVLNHTRSQGGASHEDVVQALNRPLTADIPFEPAQATALAQGTPLLMYQPNSLFSQTILHLSRQL